MMCGSQVMLSTLHCCCLFEECHDLYVLCLTFIDTQVPFGVIFGGTDINEDVKVEQKRIVMEQVLQKAR